MVLTFSIWDGRKGVTVFFGEEFPGSLYLPFNAEGVEAQSPALRAAARYAGNAS